jgi:glutamyl-tRNA synthetase
MFRVRFAPSPTGYLHIGGARTFIFNWLFARRNHGTMILRIDDTDVERNTQVSLDSIFEGLRWLELDWDEFYRQSDRQDLHTKMALQILENGMAYRDFTAAQTDVETDREAGPWLFNPGMREISREESDARAAKGEPFVLRFRVPRETGRDVVVHDLVYGDVSKALTDIEDFALLRSSGVPTYHMASCADDADLRITHILRGQEHLANTFKHVLIFEALGAAMPQYAHLPLLMAPDGSKLSKRKHGPVVSVTTYRDAGFLPQGFINWVSLLGWSPKDGREVLSRQEMVDAFSLEGINHSNATVNFTEEDPFDQKAMWLNGEHLRAMSNDALAAHLLPFLPGSDAETMLKVAPLVRERIRTFKEITTVADFFFAEELAPYDKNELIPQKGDLAMAHRVLTLAKELLATAGFTHDDLDKSLRGGADSLKIKAGQMFQPIRVAVCGRKNAPPLFETLEVLGRDKCLKRIGQALTLLGDQ